MIRQFLEKILVHWWARLILLSILIIGISSPLHSCFGGKHRGGFPPSAVSVQVAKPDIFQEQMTATGSLVALQGAVLKAEVEGRVTTIYFKPGTIVPVGTLLMQIYPDVVLAQIKVAEAQLVLSHNNLLRYQTLYHQRVIAKADLDKAEATFHSDEGNLEKAKAQLRETEIRAPFEGRVGLNLAEVGDYVKVGQAMVSVQQVNPMRADFTVPEMYIAQVTLGDRVRLHSNAYPKDCFMGTVYAIDSRIDPSTRMLALRASIPNQDMKLLPGGFVDMTVPLGKPMTAIRLPQTAIINDEDKSFVYRYIKGKAVRTSVTVGMRSGNDIAVIEGIHPGDIVVTEGGFKLTDGADIIPIGLPNTRTHR